MTNVSELNGILVISESLNEYNLGALWDLQTGVGNCLCPFNLYPVRDLEFTDIPFIITVMPEWFYRASSPKPGFPLKARGNDKLVGLVC